jgi:hypothetical protein
MCVDCVLASLRIAQVDPGNEPLTEVVLSQIPTMERAQGLLGTLEAESDCQPLHALRVLPII